MALIACEECGRQISTKATACPGCGAPRTEKTVIDGQAREVAVSIKQDSPVGDAVVAGVRAAQRSPVWRRLYETVLVLTMLVGFAALAVGLYFVFVDGEIGGFVWIPIGLIPYAAVRAVGSWFSWLFKPER